MTKAAIVPPLIVPSATPSAPRHISKVIAPKISMITSAVITARMVMRRLAVAKLRSTAPAKRSDSRFSWLNACTTFTAPSTSPTIAPMSATRSWLERETLRSRRPNQARGSTTTGMPITSPSVSVGTNAKR